MKHDDLIALIEAHRDGKKLQVQGAACSEYLDMSSDLTAKGVALTIAQCHKVRIKPEPREWYLYDCGNDVLHAATPEQQMIGQYINTIKVREVLE